MARQQQQPDNIDQVNFLPSPPAESIFPSTSSPWTTSVFKDTDRRQVKSGQLASNFAALSRLLTIPQPTEQVISTALDVATRLLPEDWTLRLFEKVDAGVRLREVGASGDQRADMRQAPQATLGFGEEIDRQVLVEHIPVTTGRVICVPLIDAREVLVGALVTMRGSESVGADDDTFLTVIAAHLTSLLARGAAERQIRSSALVMRALPRLALPSMALTQSSGPTAEAAALDALFAAQDHVLTEAVAALQELIRVAGYAESVVTLAMTPMRSGEWKLLRADVSTEDVAGVVSHEMLHSILHLLPQSHDNMPEPMNVEIDSQSGMWGAIASLRTQIAESIGGDVAHLTLLPIVDEHEIVALLLLAHRMADVDVARLLPLITTIAAAAAAGLKNLHLTEQARAEARGRDAFISLAGHELRGPLTALKGYSQLLMRQTRKNPIPEPMLRSVESIEQQSVRMAEMVSELLDASRIRRGALEVQTAAVDLVPLVRRVVERRGTDLPQHTITLDVAEESIIVLADAQRVEQVLRDLIDNAARHMPKGGLVAVTLSRQGDQALFKVRDQGIGVPEGERERIFEYVYRSSLSESKNLSGLGLGLYVSRHLIERFGGELWLEATSTTEPTGSDFRFTLPLTETPVREGSA